MPSVELAAKKKEVAVTNDEDIQTKIHLIQ